MESPNIYDLLAGGLEYPGEDYGERIADAVQALTPVHPDAATHLGEFSGCIGHLSTEVLQELYTQTFDLNPVCSLELGWHLFGENYDRGTFLVKMRQQLRRFQLVESSELPDHLTHALAVLGRMEPEEAEEFAGASVLPALEKMRAGLRGKGSVFENVLEAIACVVLSRYPHAAFKNHQDAPVLRVLD